MHAICVHLGLFEHWRHQQLKKVADHIEQYVSSDALVIRAGDFNNWGSRDGSEFAKRLHLKRVFEHHAGKSARSFPAWLPLLRLDRIYLQGFQIKHVEKHASTRLVKLSDHAILTATLIKNVNKMIGLLPNNQIQLLQNCEQYVPALITAIETPAVLFTYKPILMRWIKQE